MSELRVLSLHQPWASLIMLGAKRFETRPGPPNGDMRPAGVRAGVGGCAVNRGDIIGIASTAQLPHPGWVGDVLVDTLSNPPVMRYRSGAHSPLPLGALLGTVRVVDAYPIVGVHQVINRPKPAPKFVVDTTVLGGYLCLSTPGNHPEGEDIEAQRRYGDWSVGRWAIELADPTPTTERCPWPECSHGSVPAHDPIWPDMTAGGEPLDQCPVCHAEESCPPIPVSGRQGVWRLTPDRFRYPTENP